MFFPWSCSEGQKKNYGLYPYYLNLKAPYPSKNVIRELIYSSTKIEIKKQKLSLNKTLVIILIQLDKTKLITFNNVIKKYDIFVNKNNPEINWIGSQKYSIKNILDENSENNIFKCKFIFMTLLKGAIDISKISIQLYLKKGINNETKIIINHITKPFSIFIE